jgi:hypothetical protein
MNERIRQLAEQAGMTDDKFGMFFAKDNHNEDGVDLEKFAELIVRECLTFVEPMPGSGDIDDLALEAAREGIKEHFGVE